MNVRCLQNLMNKKKKCLLVSCATLICILVAAFGCGKKEEPLEKKEKREREAWAAKERAIAEKKVVGKEEKKVPEPILPVLPEGELALQASYVQGEVKMGVTVAAAKVEFVPVNPGMTLPAGAKITTQSQSQGDLELPQKDLKIRVKENTDVIGGSFAFLRNKKQGRLEMRTGTTYIKIEEGYRGTLKVVTPMVEVTAMGTAFCVEVYGDMGDTWVGVAEGEADVANLLTAETEKIEEGEALEFRVAEQKTEIAALEADEKAMIMQEVRRIGSMLPEELEPKIELILPKSKERLETYLTATAIATNGKEPRRVHALLMRSLTLMEKGITEENKEALLKSIQRLNEALLFYKDQRYAPQLLMFIAAYYRDLREYEKAIAVLEKVRSLYPDSPLASLAAAAEGRIYEDDLKKLDKAEERYLLILSKYADTLEKEAAMDGLDRLRMKRSE